MGPVVSAAGQDADAGRLDMQRQTITVQLDVTGLIWTGWDLRRRQRQAGLDSLRHRIQRESRRRWIDTLRRRAPNHISQRKTMLRSVWSRAWGYRAGFSLRLSDLDGGRLHSIARRVLIGDACRT